MLDTATARANAARIAFDVEIASVATAVPANIIHQEEMRRRAHEVSPDFSSLDTIYFNSGVSTRHFCEPTEWYTVPRTWEERTASFTHHAVDLLEEVAVNAIEAAGLRLNEIDAIVTNTITGLTVPSLDALLMNRLAFAPQTERLPIFGFGCGGGVGGLSRSTRLAQAIPGGNVLFLTVDLCSLCLRINDPRIVMFVAAALFGDGAAAVVLRNTRGNGGSHTPPLGKIIATGEYLWRDTGHMLGWDVMNDGFGIVLSAALPRMMEENLGGAVDDFLTRNGLSRDDLKGFLFHPGGARIIEAAQTALTLPPDALDASRATLKNYGNMSAATVLFILKHAVNAGRKGLHLMAAFGPGFTAYFTVVDL